ncbi:hypothetical protein [Neobacillus sp.]|uniref:hypothetical protein n=1 Tax=Neobacillus sp. TaxID=2675273 RepID=UPI00289F94EA|nr:hypothetical protein [Neobacillus sp.]
MGHASAADNMGHASAADNMGHASAVDNMGHASAVDNMGHALDNNNHDKLGNKFVADKPVELYRVYLVKHLLALLAGWALYSHLPSVGWALDLNLQSAFFPQISLLVNFLIRDSVCVYRNVCIDISPFLLHNTSILCFHHLFSINYRKIEMSEGKYRNMSN